MRKILLIICLLMIGNSLHGQKFGIKTNLLYDATATINLGIETALGKRTTLDISGNYNAWDFGDARWRHWMVQPEFRVWLCERFNGHFFGLHGHAGEHNIGGFNPFGLDESLKYKRHQGEFWGAGLSYGYQWILNDSWKLKLTTGAGCHL